MFLHRLQTEKNDETFGKLLISKDGSQAVRTGEEKKNRQIYDGNENLLKRSFIIFIIIRRTLRENSRVRQEKLTKGTPTYYSNFFRVRQVRNLSLRHKYVHDVRHLSHPG